MQSLQIFARLSDMKCSKHPFLIIFTFISCVSAATDSDNEPLRGLHTCAFRWGHHAADAGPSSEKRSESHTEPVYHCTVLYHLLDSSVHHQLCAGLLSGLYHPSWVDELLYHTITCQLCHESSAVRLSPTWLQICSQELALLFIWQQRTHCRYRSPRQVYHIHILSSLTYLLS
jgi:hypothetical protein